MYLTTAYSYSCSYIHIAIDTYVATVYIIASYSYIMSSCENPILFTVVIRCNAPFKNKVWLHEIIALFYVTEIE